MEPSDPENHLRRVSSRDMEEPPANASDASISMIALDEEPIVRPEQEALISGEIRPNESGSKDNSSDTTQFGPKSLRQIAPTKDVIEPISESAVLLEDKSTLEGLMADHRSKQDKASTGKTIRKIFRKIAKKPPL